MMSMHKIPLTQIEEAGLRGHGLDIGTPSQLSDAFRQGVAWGLNSVAVQEPEGWKLVPIEPTQEMCQRGQEKAREWPKFPLRIAPIYQAMLAASPTLDKEAK